MKWFPGNGLLVVGLVILISCKFSKVLKNPDLEVKYEAAIRYYEEKDYSKALQILDQMMTAVKATDKAEDIYFYYAYCYFHQKDYTLASYYFKRFYSNFPNSARAEECLFKSAYCNFLNAPVYSLDQSNTNEAIKELQLFINIYPKSKWIPECNDLIDKSREKLEMKDYKIAKLYFRMGDYAAAIMSFQNILNDFPETIHREEILFLILKSYHKYAMLSVREKQYERYTGTSVAFQDFIREYPVSKFADEAKGLNIRAQEELKRMAEKDKELIDKESKRVIFK